MVGNVNILRICNQQICSLLGVSKKLKTLVHGELIAIGQVFLIFSIPLIESRFVDYKFTMAGCVDGQTVMPFSYGYVDLSIFFFSSMSSNLTVRFSHRGH